MRAIRVTPSFGFGTTARQTLAIARNSLVEVAANPCFAGVLLVCAVWSGSLVEKAAERPFDTLTWPATMVVTAALSRDFLVGPYVLVGLYAGALVWQDRHVRVAEIADVTPVAEGPALAGRYCSRSVNVLILASVREPIFAADSS